MPLSYHDISVYAHDYGYANTLEDLDEFCQLMRAMDGKLLDHAREKKPPTPRTR